MAQLKAIYEREYCGCDTCLGDDIDDGCYDANADHSWCRCYYPLHDEPGSKSYKTTDDNGALILHVQSWDEDPTCVNIKRQRITILKTVKNFEYLPAIWASPWGYADDIPAKLIIGRKEYENLIYLEVDGEVLLDDRDDEEAADAV